MNVVSSALPLPSEPAEEAPPTRRLLVVDDLPHVLDLMRGMARRVPGVRVRVDVEVSAFRAMGLLAREPYDLVVSDHRLIDADGLSILGAARRARPETRRVLMTGYQDVPATLDQLRDARVDAYLAKPFPAADTIRLLGAMLLAHEPTLAFTRAHARGLEARAAEHGAGLNLASLRPPAFS